MSSPYFEIMMNLTTLATSDDPNGIINLQVSKEINTAGSCSFTVLPTCSRYDEFQRMRCYIDVEMYGVNVFRGRVTEISSDHYNQLSVTCEGALAYLNDFYARVGNTFSYMYRDLDRIMTSEAVWLTYGDQANDELIDGFPIKNMALYGLAGNGCIELDYDGGNMIPYTALINARIDANGNVVADPAYTLCSDYIQTKGGQKYQFAITDLYTRDASNAIKVYVAEYTGTVEAPVFQRVVEVVSWNAWYEGLGGLIRPFCTSSYGDLWLGEVTDADSETESDAGKIVKFSDYITDRYLDKRGMMVRTKVMSNGVGHKLTYLQFLHPKRNWYPKKFSFADNIISVSKVDPSIDEVYSVLVATFKGTVYNNSGTYNAITYEIPGAVEKFGVIYHTVDFNQNPFNPDPTSSAYQAIMKKLQQYADIYNPVIPNKFSVTGLDPFLFDPEGKEPIDVGDPVEVESAPHNISAVRLCLSMKLDFANPQNNQYEIGDFVKDGEDNRLKSLTESFAKTKKKAKK